MNLLKNSKIRVFLSVSVLIGTALCILHSVNYFDKFDNVIFCLESCRDIKRIPFFIECFLIIFYTLFPGIIIFLKGNEKGIFISIFLWMPYVFTAYFLFNSYQTILPLTSSFLGSIVSIIRVLGWGAGFLEKEKNEIRKTFGYFLEPSVVDMLIENPGLVTASGVKKKVTILFADLRGFTKVCGLIPAETVIEILNEYFGKMISIARKHGGTIDKLIGDAIMIVWGDPVPQADHQERAVKAAIQMQSGMKDIKSKWAEKLNVSIELGIGIHTDEVIVGTIGSQEFCDYTVLGNGVNLASRIESGCPGGEIQVSKEIYEILKDRYKFEFIGNREYKNIQDKIEIYKIIC